MGATGRHAPPHRAWLDPLPELISLRSLPGAPASTTGGLPPVVYGAKDRPAEQAQRYLTFDLETGTHLLIGGAPQSGRTTALRTIAARIDGNRPNRNVIEIPAGPRRVQIRAGSGDGQRGWGPASPWTSSSAHAVLPVTVTLAGQAIHPHLPARQSTRANPKPDSSNSSVVHGTASPGRHR